MALDPQYTGSGNGLYPASSQSQIPGPVGGNKIESVPAASGVGVNAAGQLRTSGLQSPVSAGIKKSNIFSRCPTGQVQSVTSKGGFTGHYLIRLAARPTYVRIGFFNIQLATETAAGAFSFDDRIDLTDANRSKGSAISSWHALTFAGAGSVTKPAAASAARPSLTWSDWIAPTLLVDRVDGGTGYAMHLRVVAGTAAGAQTRFTSIWDADAAGAVAQAPHVFAAYESNTAVDYATTNRGSFYFNASASAGSGNAPAVIVQYMSYQAGIGFATWGDSIRAGVASDASPIANGYGTDHHMRDRLEQLGIVAELANFGWTGQTSTAYGDRAADMMSSFPGHVALLNAGTPNDFGAPIGAGNLTITESGLGRMLMLAASIPGMTPMTQTLLPANQPVGNGGSGGAQAKNWGSSDALRTALNARLLASGMLCYDEAAFASGVATASGQIEFAPNMTADGLHMLETAQKQLGYLKAEYVRSKIIAP